MADLNEILRQITKETAEKTSKRKCFISYYSGDELEVKKFIQDFGDVFIPRVIGITDRDDFINSNDSDYVMKRIREKYLGDSTVTLLMIGSCTHSRRYIDWELKSSLRQGEYLPNGLIGIVLPSLGTSSHLPQRFKDNWSTDESSSYAMYKSYPQTKAQLREWIDSAYNRRNTHAQYISNSQTMCGYSRECIVHKQTH